MINISKLWNNAKFNQLTNNAKILYLFLISNPSINLVGVTCLELSSIVQQLKTSIDSFRQSTKELVDKQLIYVKKYADSDYLYFIVPAHFSTITKSDAMIEKIKSDIKSLPNDLQKFLKEIGITTDKLHKKFDKPTPEEVSRFAMENGHMINGEEFCNFYEEKALHHGKKDVWVDGNGKLVKDWKAKLKRVWFKPINQLKKCDSAPEGYEYFFVKIKDNFYYPDYWKDGKPFSKDATINNELKKEYEKIRR